MGYTNTDQLLSIQFAFHKNNDFENKNENYNQIFTFLI